MTVAAHRFDNALRRRPEHHAQQARLTPPYVLEPTRRLLGGIELDPCSESDNPTDATRFCAPPQDGCALPWDARSIFCNPPYGAARDRWVERCIAEAGRGARRVADAGTQRHAHFPECVPGLHDLSVPAGPGQIRRAEAE